VELAAEEAAAAVAVVAVWAVVVEVESEFRF
jgi:hypothetical protein